MCHKVQKVLNNLPNYAPTRKFWQRLAGLLNFAILILNLPFVIVQCALFRNFAVSAASLFIHNKPFHILIKFQMHCLRMPHPDNSVWSGLVSERHFASLSLRLPILQAKFMAGLVVCIKPGRGDMAALFGSPGPPELLCRLLH